MMDETFHLTPLDVRRYEFGKAIRGYDPERVNQFRDQVAEELERLSRLNQELEAKARGFHEQLRAFRERDKAINEALVSAQQLRGDIREQADKEAGAHHPRSARRGGPHRRGRARRDPPDAGRGGGTRALTARLSRAAALHGRAAPRRDHRRRANERRRPAPGRHAHVAGPRRLDDPGMTLVAPAVHAAPDVAPGLDVLEAAEDAAARHSRALFGAPRRGDHPRDGARPPRDGDRERGRHSVRRHSRFSGCPRSSRTPGVCCAARSAARTVIAMQGRFHRYEGYSLQQVTFPVRVLRALGADTLFVSNACGGLNPLWNAGDLMLITDHLNLLGDSPLIGPNDDRLGPRFPDMSAPYDPALGALARRVAADAGHRRCAKACTSPSSGPNLETRAEYRFLRAIGADVVGMSTVPEMIVAVHAGMRVLGLSIITDMCDPDALEPATVGEDHRRGERAPSPR